jgi:hypothetical protein
MYVTIATWMACQAAWPHLMEVTGFVHIGDQNAWYYSH